MKNKIKISALILVTCIFCVQCQSQVTNKVILEGKTFLDMPFEQVDFNNENVYDEIACQEQHILKMIVNN